MRIINKEMRIITAAENGLIKKLNAVKQSICQFKNNIGEPWYNFKCIAARE